MSIPPGASPLRFTLGVARVPTKLDPKAFATTIKAEAAPDLEALTRGGPTQSVWLRSGDVAILGGAARLAFHGIDRVRAGSSTLLPKGGRINLTLRVVD